MDWTGARRVSYLNSLAFIYVFIYYLFSNLITLFHSADFSGSLEVMQLNESSLNVTETHTLYGENLIFDISLNTTFIRKSATP